MSKLNKLYNKKLHNKKQLKEEFIFGGGGGIGDIFEPIIKPIQDIGKFFNKIFGIMEYIGKIIVWLFAFIKWLVFDLLNPLNLITDFVGTITKITSLMVYTVVDVFFSIFRYMFNTVFGQIFTGIWGWDNKEYEKNKKCYKPPENRLPMTVIITTVLLPPLGLFLEYGISYWIYIIICTILTYFYYFPGLLYALVLLYQ